MDINIYFAARGVLALVLYFVYRKIRHRLINKIVRLLSNIKLFSYYDRKLKLVLTFSLNALSKWLVFFIWLFGNDFTISDTIDDILISGLKIIALAIAYRLLQLMAILTESYLLDICETWDIEENERKSFKTILPLGISAAKTVLTIALVLYFITIFGVDITPFLNFGLVITAVLGYALNASLQDYLGLFKILTDSLYVEGDKVTFIISNLESGADSTELSGTVLKITPNYTHIILASGSKAAVSNRFVDCIVLSS